MKKKICDVLMQYYRQTFYKLLILLFQYLTFFYSGEKQINAYNNTVIGNFNNWSEPKWVKRCFWVSDSANIIE